MSSSTLNAQQFGEQLHLFDTPEPKSSPQEPRYAQLHLPFPSSPPPAPKIDWSTPMRQSRWTASLRARRSLGGAR